METQSILHQSLISILGKTGHAVSPLRKAVLMACCGSLASPVVTAQQSALLLEEVIVTAQKRKESANDVGMAISAFRGDDLETLGFTDTRDLAELTPGLTMAISSSGTPIYTMRGIGFNTLNMSSTSPVGVYVDEAAYPYSIMSKGLTFDVERVEVLKGPQGTLYGRNTTGGLINYISNKPSEEFEASVKVEYGEYESYGFEGVINGALSDSVSARMAVKTNQSDEGWQESVSRDDELGEVDRSAVKLALNWDINEDASLLVNANWWEDQSDTQAGQAIAYNPEVFTPKTESELEAAGLPALLGLSNGREVAEALFVVPNLQASILSNPDSEDADWAAPNQPSLQPGSNWLPLINLSGYGIIYDISSFPTWPGGTATPRPDEFAMDTDMHSLSARLDWALDERLVFTSLTTYAKLERDDIYDRSGTPYELVVFNDNGEIKSFSQEFRFTGETDQFKYIAGLYYSKDESKDRSNPWAGQTSILEATKFKTVNAYGGLGLLPVVLPDNAAMASFLGGFRDWQNFSNIDTTSKAVFGQLEWSASDTVLVTAGLRYTDDQADFEGCSRDAGNGNILDTWNLAFLLIGNFNPAYPQPLQPGQCGTNLYSPLDPENTENPGGGTPVLPAVTKELDEDNWSGRLAVNWDVTADSMLYASFSRGFKSGAFPQLSGNVASQYDPATQEEVKAYEVGVKSTLLDGAMQLNASAYLYDYEDKQVFGEVQDDLFNTLTRLVNVPESEVKGAEMDVTWTPTERVVTRLAVSWMDTEIEEYVGYNKLAQLVDFKGSEFEYSPEWQANALISYGYDLTNNLQSQLTLDVSYTDDQQGDFEGAKAFEVDSYTLVGLNYMVFPTDNQWEASAWVRNLTDEYYWTSVQTQTDTVFRYAGMPRTWGVSLKYNF